jgi:hypothetical protein
MLPRSSQAVSTAFTSSWAAEADGPLGRQTIAETFRAPDADLLRDMIAFAAERLMEMEVAAKTGAGYGERSSGRLTRRNATATETGGRAGTVAIRMRQPSASSVACDA